MGKKKEKLTFKEFLKKKDVNISAKTYFVDAMSGMAQGLFASLLVGTILSTAANYIEMIDLAFFQRLAHFMHVVGYITSANSPVTGAAIAVGIAAALKAPGCCRDDILKIAENLMSCDGLGGIGILQAVASYHIRRIACYNVKRGSIK